ncbi:MAG: class I SAM-dependent methyltransferase [Proteobacteria bacterium]|nr:class I SAM-dependent methyltransferase [Pseudomonadota bacterium]
MKALKEIVSGPVFRVLGYRPQTVSVSTWDKEYRQGDWNYLEDIGSIAGQATILGYCQFLKPATILDVGCGAGALAEKLKLLPYRAFLGIDISAEAIAQAAPRADFRTTFAVSPADGFHTDKRFDLIIFNQCVNYFEDPAAVMAHYRALLAPNGRIIVSMCETARARAAWPLVEKHLAVEDAITYIQAEGRGTTKVLRPRR